MRTTTLLLAATAALVAADSALAQDKNTDRIYLTDGTVLKDVGVTTDGLQQVEYRSGRSKSTVESERILRIEFGLKPKAVDQADGYAKEEEFLDAIAEMQNYLNAIDGKGDKRFPWAAAYARYRLVELHGVIGDVDALSRAAEELVAKDPESRYAPIAFIAKAQALLDSGNVAGAKAAAEGLGRFVEAKALAGRWPVEQRLWAAMTSGNTGKKLEDALAAISADAVEYPSVRNRAEVAIAESLVGGKKLSEAEKIFREIVKDSKADARTLAAAWTGLGDCLYTRADSAVDDDKATLLRDALKAYLRPVVVYPDESLYVAKAAFYAGRCYQELGGGDEASDRAKRLLTFVIVNFKGTKWEREARSFINRR